MDDCYQEYVTCCQRSVVDEKVFANFKNQTEFQSILEHLDKTQGTLYANEITLMLAQHKVDLNWVHIMKNDLHGNPTKFIFHLSGVGKLLISPSTLRYVCLAMKVLHYIKSKSLKHVSFHEIGGGYGGQAFIFYQICEAYNVNIKNYSIYDLPEVLSLQQKYLSNILRPTHLLHIRFVNPYSKHVNIVQDNNFLFSAYAIGEFSQDNQQVYYQLMHNKMMHGYIVWNNKQPPKDDFYLLTRGFQSVEEIDESPATCWWNKVYQF